MRLALVLTTLALAGSAPASASSDAATGGVAVPPGTTGGLAVPGQADGGPGDGAPSPDGGARTGEATEPPGGPRAPASARPRASAAGARAESAQDEQSPAPPTQDEPDDGDVDVQVPIDDDAGEPGPPPPAARSGAPFGGLAPTGLALAAFTLLGLVGAGAGLGLRRLAR